MKSNQRLPLKSRKVKGFKAKYVSDIVKYSDIKDKEFNLIEAPCGTGKTTFVMDKVIKQAKNKERVIYLVDTTILEESLINKYQEFLKPYNYGEGRTMLLNEGDIEDGFGINVGEIIQKDNRAFCMTYSKFANILHYNQDEEFLDKIEFLCCDEAHHLATYMGFEDIEKDQTRLYKSLEKIIDATNRGVFKTILMTATPYRINKLLSEDFNYTCVKLADAKDLCGYRFNRKKVFSNIENFLKNFKKSAVNSVQKYLIYIESISKSLDAQEILKENGFNVVCLWSINNIKKMDDRALSVREYIINYEDIPEEIDVIIINAAYETGYNIYDNKGLIQTVIVNSRQFDIITQVRGRIRHDIDLLITLDQSGDGIKKIDDSCVEFSNANLEKYFEIPLTTVEKEQLARELNLKNRNGRLLKWTSIKKILIENGYFIRDTTIPINGKRTKANIIFKPLIF